MDEYFCKQVIKKVWESYLLWGVQEDINHVLPQVQELQHRAMLPSVSSPSDTTTGHAVSSGQRSTWDESVHYNAKISSLAAQVEELKVERKALLARLSHAEEEEGGRLAKLDTEVAQLKTDRQLLISRLGTAEQLLAEARRGIDQKEGHLQGLQVSAAICPFSFSCCSSSLLPTLQECECM